MRAPVVAVIHHGKFFLPRDAIRASPPTPEPQLASRLAVTVQPVHTVANGPALWAMLHRRALACEGCEDYAWLVAFETRLPCGPCRADWSRMLRETPNNIGDYFAWTVARHNEVNRRLGKPDMPETVARLLWQDKPAPQTGLAGQKSPPPAMSAQAKHATAKRTLAGPG